MASSRYIDPAPLGNRITRDEQTGLKRVFIPSKVDNNRHIDVEAYKQNLRASGSKELVSAWLDGDWSVTLGAFFDCWDSKRHVVRPFAVPAEWMRFRSMDWGSASPFSVGWWAVVQDDFETDGRTLPRGCLVRYREWYGMKPGQPNVGVKINADVIGLSIAQGRRTRKSLTACSIRLRSRKTAALRWLSASARGRETRSTSAAQTTGALPGMGRWGDGISYARAWSAMVKGGR